MIKVKKNNIPFTNRFANKFHNIFSYSEYIINQSFTCNNFLQEFKIKLYSDPILNNLVKVHIDNKFFINNKFNFFTLNKNINLMPRRFLIVINCKHLQKVEKNVNFYNIIFEKKTKKPLLIDCSHNLQFYKHFKINYIEKNYLSKNL